MTTHLGCTRQNVARLTAEGIIEKLADGRYNQDHARLKYIAHRRGSARVPMPSSRRRNATDPASHRGETARPDPDGRGHRDLDAVVGVMLTVLGGAPARYGGPRSAIEAQARNDGF